MPDQANQLRKLVRGSIQADATLAPGGAVVAVSGAQSAAGVTTIACGLARELARLGKQVVVIDANLHHPSVAEHFNTEPRGMLTDVLTGARRAIEILTPTTEDNLRLLAGGAACGLAPPPLDREALDRFAAETAALSRQADVILIDAGAHMNAWIDHVWQLARQVLLVSKPTDDSLLDAYAAVKLSQFHRHDNKIRLFFNGANNESEATPLAKRFAETCQRFLFVTPKQAASLPAKSPQRQQGSQDSDPFQRSLRLLAADLAGDLRVVTLRIARPQLQTMQAFRNSARPEDLSQRRRDAEGMQRF